MFKGGRFEKIIPPQEQEAHEGGDLENIPVGDKKPEDIMKIEPMWIDNGAKPKDIATLVFNIFLYKINIGLKLDSRTIMSAKGDSIYVVIKADDGDLREAAEDNEFTMQLALGLTDLTSLEP